jgi:hypothetical protein
VLIICRRKEREGERKERKTEYQRKKGKQERKMNPIDQSISFYIESTTQIDKKKKLEK